MMHDLISVIIPTRNRIETILRSVESVVNQRCDFFEIEIIIVDDNDNDNTLELTSILSQYQNVDIRVIRNSKIHGAAYARNLGVESANGLYVTFLDDDDVYLQNRISSMYKLAESTNYSFISSGRIYENNDFSHISMGKQLFGEIDIYKNSYINDIDIGIFIKKQLFIDIGGFDTKYNALEDWDLFIRLLKINKAYKIKRYDYAVNIDNDKERVTDKEGLAYMNIANTYKSFFGLAWYYIQCSNSDLRTDKLTLYKAIKYSILSHSFIPIKNYIVKKANFR